MAKLYIHNLDEIASQRAVTSHRIMAAWSAATSTWLNKQNSENQITWRAMMRGDYAWDKSTLLDFCVATQLNYAALTAKPTEEELRDIRFLFHSRTDCCGHLKVNMAWLRKIAHITLQQLGESLGLSRQAIDYKETPDDKRFFTRRECLTLLTMAKNKGVAVTDMTPEDMLNLPAIFQARIPKEAYSFEYRARTLHVAHYKANLKWFLGVSGVSQRECARRLDCSPGNLHNCLNSEKSRYLTRDACATLIALTIEKGFVPKKAVVPENFLLPPDQFQALAGGKVAA